MRDGRFLAILPESIGGRLTVSSIIDGFVQNGCDVTVYDELFDSNLDEILKADYSAIVGYDFSGLKIKVDNDLKIPSLNYFSDEIRSNTSGKYWQDYLEYLYQKDNYVYYWDRELINDEDFENIYYLPHFVNFDIYRPTEAIPEFDIMFAGRLDTDYRLSMFEELILKLNWCKVAWYAIDRHYQDARQRARYPELIDLCYQGFIDNEKDMARAINKSKIVFNMNSQGISSLNYRTIQTIACKKLLLSDYRDELDLFKGNLPYYNDFSDLIFKIESYLEDDYAYNKVTNACYKIAQKNHNSLKGAKFMLDKAGL